jgi:hypothetical protein
MAASDAFGLVLSLVVVLYLLYALFRGEQL